MSFVFIRPERKKLRGAFFPCLRFQGVGLPSLSRRSGLFFVSRTSFSSSRGEVERESRPAYHCSSRRAGSSRKGLARSGAEEKRPLGTPPKERETRVSYPGVTHDELVPRASGHQRCDARLCTFGKRTGIVSKVRAWKRGGLQVSICPRCWRSCRRALSGFEFAGVYRLLRKLSGRRL